MSLCTAAASACRCSAAARACCNDAAMLSRGAAPVPVIFPNDASRLVLRDVLSGAAAPVGLAVMGCRGAVGGSAAAAAAVVVVGAVVVVTRKETRGCDGTAR